MRKRNIEIKKYGLFTALCAALFLLALCLSFSAVTEYGQISFADGTQIQEYFVYVDPQSGNFTVKNVTENNIIFSSSENQPVRMRNAIISDSAGRKYRVSAQAPSVTLTTADGVNEMEYSDTSGITLTAAADASGAVFGSISLNGYGWYYKPIDGDRENGFVSIQNEISVLEFGRGLAVGKYLVKVETASEFTIEGGGENFSSEKAAAFIEITVKKNTDTIFESPKPFPSAVYGKKLADIEMRDSSNTGTWKLSRSGDGDRILLPGRYEIEYDFTPYDTDKYISHKNVKVILDISKIKLRVFIADVEVLQDGEYVYPSYTVDNPLSLLPGDTLEELNIRLSTITDTKTAGRFEIVGSIASDYYDAQFYSSDNLDNYIWSVSAAYTVYPVRVSAEFANGLSVRVSNAAGMPVGTEIGLVKTNRNPTAFKLNETEYNPLYAYALKLNYKYIDEEGEKKIAEYTPASGETLKIELSGLGNADTVVYSCSEGEFYRTGEEAIYEVGELGIIYGLQSVFPADWNWATVFLAIVAVILCSAIVYLALKIVGRKKK